MWGTNQQRDTRQRKRDAVGNLRTLAEELGLQVERRRPDLSKAEFDNLQKKVVTAARTPDHKRRIKEVAETYLGSADTLVLPTLAPLPPFPAASTEQVDSTTTEFRIRSTSCLFTWLLLFCFFVSLPTNLSRIVSLVCNTVAFELVADI